MDAETFETPIPGLYVSHFPPRVKPRIVRSDGREIVPLAVFPTHQEAWQDSFERAYQLCEAAGGAIPEVYPIIVCIQSGEWATVMEGGGVVYIDSAECPDDCRHRQYPTL